MQTIVWKKGSKVICPECKAVQFIVVEDVYDGDIPGNFIQKVRKSDFSKVSLAQALLRCFNCLKTFSTFENFLVDDLHTTEWQIALEIDKKHEKDPTGLSPSDPGAKLDDGKIFASLLNDFGLSLLEVAKVSTAGAKKYSRGGWQHVENGVERYKDALWRHLLAGRYEEIDKDTKCLHEAQVIWNALASLELKLRKESNGSET